MKLWNYLKENGVKDFSAPALVCSSIVNVLEAVEDSGISACVVIETCYRDLMQRAEKISDPDWQRSFLENVAENRAIVERWKKMHQTEAII